MQNLNYILFPVLVLSIFFLPACAKCTIPESTLSFKQYLVEILEYASLAPSSHNTQAWIVVIDQDSKDLDQQSWLIKYDNSRLLTQVDPHKREIFISVGCFVENMRRAFLAYGYQVEIKFNNDENSEVLAALSFNRDMQATVNKDSLSILTKRHSEKNKFLDQSISEDIFQELTKSYENLTFYPKGSVQADYLTKGTIEAMTKQCANLQVREELANWFRFSNKEAEAKKDGLPAEQLGMTGIKKFFYYLIMDKDSSKSDSFAKQTVALTQKQAESSAAYAVLTAGSSKQELVQLGMDFQALWLDLTVKNISVHPLTQMLEEEPFRSEIRSNLALAEDVQVLVRLGYVKNYGQNFKIRRPCNEFVVFN